MTEAKFIAAIEALGLRIEPSVDTSSGDEYVVIMRARSGSMFGDNAPVFDALDYDLYYVSPLGCNRLAICDRIRALVLDHFGAYPREEDLSDANGQIYHYAFSALGEVDRGAI